MNSSTCGLAHLMCTQKSQSTGKTIHMYKVKHHYEKPKRAQDGTVEVLSCLIALIHYAELHWICWVQHENKTWPLISASAVVWSAHQDRQVGKFKSIILFGLWFWNHCTLQRVVLCGRWLRCYNYHYNYTGMFPSWRAPWNYSPVTWPGFLIVLVRWTIALFLA